MVKAGLDALTKSLAKEVAGTGILVNSVAPGLVETDMTTELTAEAREALLALVPLGRMGRPEEVADVVDFLASGGELRPRQRAARERRHVRRLDGSGGRELTTDEMLAAVPHGAPFRFIAEILELDDDHIVAAYRFPEDADFYRGHFPQNPITPGVLLVEAMAQAGVVALGIYLLAKESSLEQARTW